MANKYTEFSYDQHARTCEPDDFWGQTRRTINGAPVPNEQIRLIVEAIKNGLNLGENDVVLEIACGNGALSQHLFEFCKGYSGTDISEYLISIAKKNFEQAPRYQFHQIPALEHVLNENDPEKYTKMLCYAGFQYLSDADIKEVFSVISSKFLNIDIIYIGSIPDKDRYKNFYKETMPSQMELKDSNTAVGIWRGKEEIESLVDKSIWNIEFFNMPKDFYASNYRFDVKLSRAS